MQKILAIDDKRDNLVTLSALLKNLMPDCAVITARSGMEGIEKAKAELPDTILLDVKMPDMDGFETCRRLKAGETTKHIPVIMITAIKTDSQSRVKGLEIGADAFLAKPIDEAELVSQVKVALRIHKAENALRRERDSLEKTVLQRVAVLRANEERHRIILRTAMDGIWRVDPQGRLLEVNEAYCRMSGYSEHELLAMRIPDLEVVETDDDTTAPIQKIMAQGEDRFESRHRRKDGSIYDVEVSVQYQSTEGGQFVAFLRDITERKRAEEALRVSHRFLEITNRQVEISPLLKEFVGEVQKFTQCAAVGIRMLEESGDIPYEAYVGFSQGFYESESPLSIESDQCMCINVIKGVTDPKHSFHTKGGSFYMNGTTRFLATASEEEKGRTRNVCNEIGYESVALVPIRAEGRIMGLIHFADLRENMVPLGVVEVMESAAMQLGTAIGRVQAQEQKREQERLNQTMLDSLPCVALLMRPKTREIIAMNKVAKEAGCSLGHTCFGTWPKFEQPCPWCLATKVWTDGQAQRLEVETLRVVWDAHWEPISDDLYLHYAFDITDRKQAEREKVYLMEQLHQAQKMEAIGTLAGGIAHDFNNILMAILGFAELAGLDLQENSKAKYNVQQSIKAAQRAQHLVQQILTFSRQEKQERKPLNIQPIVNEALKFLLASLPSTIEIRQKMEEDLGAVEGDPTEIYQVLMNLCTNAAHAMEEKGGVLEVSLGKVDIPGEASASSWEIEPGPYLRLRVSDTGHGMSPEIMKKIFDPYFTTKGVGKGTGLGLSVVRGIVKSYGGGVTVSSEWGKGSTFDVYFTRIPAMGRPLETEKPEPLPFGGHERVLFVDDEKAIVEIGQNMLTYLRYEVDVRTSSIEALELFRAQPNRFDLVITDMTMPNMTGDRLAQELIRIRPGIPIILCTGFSGYITEEKARARGIQEFAMKPLVMKDLAVVIRRALDREKKKR